MHQLRDNTQRASFAVIMLWLALVFEILAAGIGYSEYMMLTNLMNDPGSSDSAMSIFALSALFGIVQVLVGIVCIVAFILWFRRAYFNLHLAIPDAQFAEGWAAGSWFVPILNLFRPYQIMEELYKETREILRKHYTDFTGLSLVFAGWWWGFWILNGIFGRIQFRITLSAESIDELIRSSSMSMISPIFGVPAALLAVKVVKDYARHEPLFAEIIMQESIGHEQQLLIDPGHTEHPSAEVTLPETDHRQDSAEHAIRIEALLEMLRTKHDKFIYNVVTQRRQHAEYLEAAEIVYRERDLDAPAKQELIRNFSSYVDLAAKQLKSGSAAADAIRFLQEKGIPAAHAHDIVEDLKQRK